MSIYIVKHFISKLIYCWPSSGSFDRETRSLLQQTGSADEVFQLMARLVTFTNQSLVVKMFFRGCCCYVGLALLHMLGGVVYGVSQQTSFSRQQMLSCRKKQILIDCGMELAEIWRNELHRMALWLQGGISSHSPPRNSGVG